MSSPPDTRPDPVSFMDRVREKERARTGTAKTDETPATAPVGVWERAAPPAAKTDETPNVGRVVHERARTPTARTAEIVVAPIFVPGPPYFEQIGPSAWIETAWARARCVLCPAMLAAGDRIYCADHRRAGERVPL